MLPDKRDSFMDYYQILKVGPNANHKEIEEAYNRLVKESRYNATISRKDVDAAYKILSDPHQRELYDSLKVQKTKRMQRAAARPRKQNIIKNKIELRHLLIILAVLTLIAAIFYSYRFGYHLKSFSPGDVLYYTHNNKRLGKIIRVDPNHDFGNSRGEAYLVEIEGKNVWLPETDVKARCFAD
jgi:curved DNA-binding protein CbpA